MSVTVVVVVGDLDEVGELLDKVINNKTVQAAKSEDVEKPTNKTKQSSEQVPLIPNRVPRSSGLPELFGGVIGGADRVQEVTDKGLEAFVGSWLVVSGEQEDRLSSGALYSMWQDWCLETGQDDVYTNASFIRALKGILGERVENYRTASERGFTGLRTRV